MERVKEVNINEAIIHVLDNNSDEPILNEKKLTLNEEVYTFLYKHIQKCLKDEELRYGKFKEERNIIKELSQEYLSGHGNFVEISKEVGKQLFILMQSNGNIPSSDLIVVSISTEIGNLIGIIKMDYVKNYTHSINFNEEKIDIDIIPDKAGLPTSSQKIQKCAFIRFMDPEQEYDLLVMDKQKKSKEEYGSNYFINKFLGCKVIENDRDKTKNLLNTVEVWTRGYFNKDAARAEKLRTVVKEKLRENDKVNIYDLASETLPIKDDRKSFISCMQEYDLEEVEIDKEYLEKKLSKLRLKVSNEIDLNITEEAYRDINRFEIKDNGDGSISMIIKNIENYAEK